METSIGPQLKRARELVGLSRRELARLAQLADPHVGMIERGDVRSPAAVTLDAIAHVLGVSVEWLLGGGAEPRVESMLAAVEHARAERVVREETPKAA